jgi:prevent-host-death family protein
MQAANAAARRRETDFKLIMAGTHQPEADLSIRSFRRSLSAGSLAARRSLLWLPQELDGVADEAAALRRARAADRNGGARRFLPRSCVGAAGAARAAAGRVSARPSSLCLDFWPSDGHFSRMSQYSIAEAKDRLSSLIERALKGEDVVITKHGRPVVELRPVSPLARPVTVADLEWLRARRVHPLPDAPPTDAGTFVSQMRDEEDERLVAKR